MGSKANPSEERRDVPSFLVLILDLDFQFLARLGPNALSPILDSVLVFVNSFLLLHRANRISIILASYPSPTIVYPTDEDIERALGGLSSGFPRHEEDHRVMLHVRKEMTRAIHSAASAEKISGPTPVSAAFTRALCLINRWNRESDAFDLGLDDQEAGDVPPAVSDSRGVAPAGGRVLIMSTGKDPQSQYVSLMNCNFSAQRMAVVVDACVLGEEDSTFLQQITHLNHGLYLRPNLCERGQLDTLLSYLLPVFLPDAATRDKLALPVQTMVDFGATCFKTGKTIHVGYTCSVCLSTFASRVFVCPTCGSRPKIRARN